MAIIDVHAHYGEWPFPIKASSSDDILRMCEKFGIERCIFSSTLAIVADMVAGNAELKAFIEPQDAFLGYVVVNPNYLELSKQEMGKYLYNPKFVGLKLHPGYSGQSINSSATKELLTAYLRYNKPLLAHVYSEYEVNALLEVAKEFPTLKMVMGHMGGVAWQVAIEAVSKVTSIYLEICSSNADVDKVKEAVDKVGARRIVYGSDMTLLNPAFTIGMVKGADIVAEDKERIFYKNARELFGL